MSWPYFLAVMRSRWWVIAVTVILAVGASLAYTRVQPRLYQATATTFAYPIGQNANDAANSVGLLTYGNMADTFASLAESRYYLGLASRGMGLTTAMLATYSAKAATLPQTTVLQVSVIGPDPRLVARLAGRLVQQVGAATVHYFRVFGLHALDAATVPKKPIQPQPMQQALSALLAGLLAGYAFAVLSFKSARQPSIIVLQPGTLPRPIQRQSGRLADLLPIERVGSEQLPTGTDMGRR